MEEKPQIKPQGIIPELPGRKPVSTRLIAGVALVGLGVLFYIFAGLNGEDFAGIMGMGIGALLGFIGFIFLISYLLSRLEKGHQTLKIVGRILLWIGMGIVGLVVVWQLLAILFI